jgi:hypothetical protein
MTLHHDKGETTVHPMAALWPDPHGSGECHYDVGNIIDHAITAFVSPFTSDGMFEPSWMALDLTRNRRVEEPIPWQACMAEFQTSSFLSKFALMFLILSTLKSLAGIHWRGFLFVFS